MIYMYKIAVIGDYESICGFAALGLDIYGVNDLEEAEITLKRLAESNKRIWHFENIRYYLLQLADTLERYPEMIAATDKEYGEGVTLFIVKAIREHYGVS